MAGIMKTILNVANALAKDEFALCPRRVLEPATIEGARAMGIAAEPADVQATYVEGRRL